MSMTLTDQEMVDWANANLDRVAELEAEIERLEAFVEHLLGECPPNCKNCGE